MEVQKEAVWPGICKQLENEPGQGLCRIPKLPQEQKWTFRSKYIIAKYLAFIRSYSNAITDKGNDVYTSSAVFSSFTNDMKVAFFLTE